MEERTEISELGEFGLIEYLTRNFEIYNASTVESVGDDCAVIDHFGKQTVVTTDLLLEGVHFDLMYTPLKHLGYKSVIVNLSDVFAMGAKPTQITLSVGISNKMSVEAMAEFYEGVYLACHKYKVDLVGGDTSVSAKGFVISVTALGEVAPDKFIKRNTAKVGDLICVSGNVGGAFLGLELLEREKQIFLENPKIQPNLEGEDFIVGRFLKPEAREDIIDFFEKAKITPTSMMDISDGVSSEVLHLCKDSNVGCKIYEDKLPIEEATKRAALKFNLDPTVCALNGGEDYELMFTIKQEDYDQLLINDEISVIGYVTEITEGCKFISRSGNEHELKAQGWNAFNK